MGNAHWIWVINEDDWRVKIKDNKRIIKEEYTVLEDSITESYVVVHNHIVEDYWIIRMLLDSTVSDPIMLQYMCGQLKTDPTLKG